MTFQPRFGYAKRAKARRAAERAAWEARRPPQPVFDGAGEALFLDHHRDARLDLNVGRYDLRASWEALDRAMRGREPRSSYHRELACRDRLNALCPPPQHRFPCCGLVDGPLPRGWFHFCPRRGPRRPFGHAMPRRASVHPTDRADEPPRSAPVVLLVGTEALNVAAGMAEAEAV